MDPKPHTGNAAGLEKDNASGLVGQSAELKQRHSQASTIQNESAESGDEVSFLRLILIHSALCISVFLVGLDLTVIATAVPRITSQFDSIQDVGWYGSAFFIALCASQPLAGKIYMQFPKKVVFLCYVALFEIGSLVCALSPNSPALIAGRAIAGLGCSGIFGGSMIIISTLVPLKKRAIWIGTLNSMYSVASIVGPVIGGALTEDVSWRWCFYINLPIGAAAALLILIFLRLKKAPSEDQSLTIKVKSLDSTGFVLFAGSIAMLLLALQWGGVTYAWNSSRIIGLFVGFGVAGITFIGWQLYMKDSALIPPSTFANRNATLIVLSALFVNGPFQTIVYWMPIWFQAVLGVSPGASGVRYLPTVIADGVTSIVGCGVVMKLGIWNPFLLFGQAMIAVGSGLLTTLYPGISDGHWIGYEIMVGVGFSFTLNMEFLGLQASTPPELAPIANTNLMTFMYASCAISLSIAQAVFQGRLKHNLAPIVSNSVTQELLSAGATNIRSIVGSTNLSAVIGAYSNAITRIFWIPAIAPAVSFLLVLGCKWISLKQDAKGSEETKESEEPQTV